MLLVFLLVMSRLTSFGFRSELLLRPRIDDDDRGGVAFSKAWVSTSSSNASNAVEVRLGPLPMLNLPRRLGMSHHYETRIFAPLSALAPSRIASSRNQPL